MASDHTKRNVEVKITLSQAEYNRLYRDSILSSTGTVQGVIREKLNLSPEPYGKNRPVISEAQFRWERDGKIGEMPKE